MEVGRGLEEDGSADARVRVEPVCSPLLHKGISGWCLLWAWLWMTEEMVIRGYR